MYNFRIFKFTRKHSKLIWSTGRSTKVGMNGKQELAEADGVASAHADEMVEIIHDNCHMKLKRLLRELFKNRILLLTRISTSAIADA